MVELARCIEKAGLEEALDDVVLRLLDPGALSAEGADVLGFVADVGCADYIERGVCGLRRRNLQQIAPDMINGFELEGAGDALRVTLFNVERGRQPEVRLNVGAPAVEVIELLLVVLGAGEVAVEADDVAAASLDPDAAEEAAEVLLARDRRYIKDRGGRVTEEVVTYIAEVIVLPVEVVGVHQQHLNEAGLVEGEVQAATKTSDIGGRVLEEAELAASCARRRILVDRVGVVVDDAFEVDAAKEVLVGLGNLAQEWIGFHVLDIGLDERSPLFDRLDDDLLAHDGL